MISVIIPLYNAERFIQETLLSVQSQTYTNWECIVVDDGSTDNGADVVKNMAQSDVRIKYVHQSNAGPSAARNLGLRLATGNYVQFLDADDWFPPQRFERMLSAYNHLNHNVILVSDYCIGNDDDISIHTPHPHNHSFKRKIDAKQLYSNFFNDISFIPGCVLFRKCALNNVVWNEMRHYSEDWEFYLNIAQSGHFVFQCLDEMLFVYRSSSNSLSKRLCDVYTSNLQLLSQYKYISPHYGYYRQYAFMSMRNIYNMKKGLVDKIYFPKLPLFRERCCVLWWKTYFHVVGLFNRLKRK